jgi:hypothetical protein
MKKLIVRLSKEVNQEKEATKTAQNTPKES